MIVNNPPNINLSQLVIDADLAMGAHNITLGAAQTVDGLDCSGVEVGATADLTGAEIKTLYEALANTNVHTDVQVTKLAGIEALAKDDLTGAEIKTLYEALANTNVHTDVQVTKLAGIEALAKDDLTGAEIKALYEALANTNVHTDVQVTKLAGIEAGAKDGKNASGTYVGDGAVSKEIVTGLTTIDGVIIIDLDATNYNWIKIAGCAAEASHIIRSGEIFAGRFASDFVGGSFFVDDQGTDGHPNNTGTNYVWIAWGS